MKRWKDIVENDSHGLIILKRTKALKEEDLLLPGWKWLYQQYQEMEIETEAVAKAALSIVNAIIYQQRRFFCLTRDYVEKIVREDINWKDRVGFSHDYYPLVIRFLTGNNIIKNIEYAGYSKRKPYMFEVVDDGVLTFLKEKEGQAEEVTKFLMYQSAKLPKKIERLLENESYIFIGNEVTQFSRYIYDNIKLNYPQESEEIDELNDKKIKLHDEIIMAKIERIDTHKIQDEYDKIVQLFDSKLDQLLAQEYGLRSFNWIQCS